MASLSTISWQPTYGERSTTPRARKTDKKRELEDIPPEQLDWRILSTPDAPPASKRRKATSNHHSNEEWEKHRQTIEDLYQVHELQDVANIMANVYNFDASIPQYKQKLNKWGVSKYTKFSAKQLLYIAQEVVRRSGQEKGPAFRLNGKRLNSRNIERALNRNLNGKDGKDFEVASLASAMSSCALSGYTSSTRGVKTSFLTLIGEESISYPQPPTNIAKCLVKINNLNHHLNRPPGSKKSSSRAPKLDPIFSDKEKVQNYLNQALELVRSGGDGSVDFQLRGLFIPEEIRLLLCFFHLINSHRHGEPFSAFRVQNCFRKHIRRRFLSEGPTPECFEVQCAWCGYSREYSADPELSAAIQHKLTRGTWSDRFIKDVKKFAFAHEEFYSWKSEFGASKEDLPKLASYLREWEAVDVERRASMEETELAANMGTPSDTTETTESTETSGSTDSDDLGDIRIIQNGNDLEIVDSTGQNRISLSDILLSDLWEEDSEGQTEGTGSTPKDDTSNDSGSPP